MKKKQALFFLFIFLGLSSCLLLGIIKVEARDPYVKINNGETLTDTRKVKLYIAGPSDTKQMKISNDSEFEDAEWEEYKTRKTWCLDYGKGNKYVYIRFKDSDGDISEVYSDYIKLDVASNMSVDFEIESGETETKSLKVKLTISWSKGVEIMKVSEDKNFKDADWEPINKYRYWYLSGEKGDKTIYIKFKDAAGREKVVSKKIYYSANLTEIEAGTLLKGTSSEVFYMGYDQKIHPIYNANIFYSWFQSFDDVKYVSDAKIDQMQIGIPLCPKPGTWLLKFKGLSDVYTVEPGCVLTHLRSPAEASIYYGPNWGTRIIELDLIMRSYFTINFPNATKLSEDDCEYCVDEYDDENDDDDDYYSNKIYVHKVCSNSAIYSVDKDKDGVVEEIEKKYGTSDTMRDSDGDELSDYEEIYYVYSDPKKADSDGDGYKDGLELAHGYNPSGPKKIESIPENSYIYPKGSLIKDKKNGYYYYRANDGKFYLVSKKNTDKNFKANSFNDRFVINETYDIVFSSSGNLGTSRDETYKPKILTDSGNLIDL
ncbi:MAG: thrombospondin type 3 repeat-containing protein [Patescibacteria group bacterium]